MKKPADPVSDHAVLRYLEVTEGLDVAAIRARIGRTVEIGLEHEASGVRADGLVFTLRQGFVVDVFPACKPPRHIGSYRRKREVE